MTFSWTKDQEDRLRLLWGEGRSTSEIAGIMLGDKKRKGAICAKARRLNLPVRGRALGSKPQANDARTKECKKQSLKKSLNPEIPLSSFREVVERDSCRYIFGDPKTPEAIYCGAEKIPGGQYCAQHQPYLVKDGPEINVGEVE